MLSSKLESPWDLELLDWRFIVLARPASTVAMLSQDWVLPLFLWLGVANIESRVNVVAKSAASAHATAQPSEYPKIFTIIESSSWCSINSWIACFTA